MHHIRERVRLINSVATVHEAQQANVPLELMLNINAFSMEHALSVEKEQKQAAEDDAQHGADDVCRLTVTEQIPSLSLSLSL